jgi:hypothetical protein
MVDWREVRAVARGLIGNRNMRWGAIDPVGMSVKDWHSMGVCWEWHKGCWGVLVPNIESGHVI